MAKRESVDPILSTLQDLLIVHLAQAGVAAHTIRKIAGVQMSKVTRIVKLLNRHKRANKNG